eukprot:Skav211821  [mRNA]  locus=scaffold305:588672:591319:- [translate_table: standard]
MNLGQVLFAVLVTSVFGRKVLKTNETGRVFTGLTCYGDVLESGKMCSSVTNMLKCPNTYAEVDAGPRAFVQCEVVDGQCLTTGGNKQKLCTLGCDDTMAIDASINLVEGITPTVSSECYKRNPTNKGYLTDGDTRQSGSGDKQYWHSCKDNKPNAEVAFPRKCIREVKIWSRADCCSHQMKGVTAEVWSDGAWKRCGGTSTDVGTKNFYSFKCAISGTKVRIIKNENSAWITTSELQVFGARNPYLPVACEALAVDTTNLVKGKTARVSSECYTRNPTNKGYLTDGDNRKRGSGDKQYWHSCNENNPSAEVDFPYQCIKEVKIWTRADCCSHQMKGVVAEVWSEGEWKRCGGTSTDVGTKNSYSFQCAIAGSKARIIRKGKGVITTSEMEVFGGTQTAQIQCDTSMPIGTQNMAKGLVADVSSECYKRNPTNKGYLTDGDNRKKGSGDKQYWHSCNEQNARAEVSFPAKCIREVKIWTRADCCSHQMKGVVAEVWSEGEWKRCGGTSTDVGRKNSFSFQCAIVGSKARIIRNGRGVITTSEMEVFGPGPQIQCDSSMKIDGKNIAKGLIADVSSECYKRNPTNKGYLTDGDNRKRGSGDKKYWHSCNEQNARAEVSFPAKCIREVKIWTRADCCSHQMKGVVAEVWSDGQWKRCGGTSTDVGRKKSYSFQCAIVGSKARIIRKGKGVITTSEMEVFGAK